MGMAKPKVTAVEQGARMDACLPRKRSATAWRWLDVNSGKARYAVMPNPLFDRSMRTRTV